MTTARERIETFVVFGGYLIRQVVPRRGEPYEHRCAQETFEKVAFAVDEVGEAGFTLSTLVEKEELPSSQVPGA